MTAMQLRVLLLALLTAALVLLAWNQLDFYNRAQSNKATADERGAIMGAASDITAGVQSTTAAQDENTEIAAQPKVHYEQDLAQLRAVSPATVDWGDARVDPGVRALAKARRLERERLAAAAAGSRDAGAREAEAERGSAAPR